MFNYFSNPNCDTTPETGVPTAPSTDPVVSVASLPELSADTTAVEAVEVFDVPCCPVVFADVFIALLVGV